MALGNNNHMDKSILATEYEGIEYYMKRGRHLYFRNSELKLRVNGVGTGMEDIVIYGRKYDIKLSIFADSNEI